MPWPACSPDLNISNTYGTTSKDEYGKNTTIIELKTAILEEWNNFSHSYIQDMLNAPLSFWELSEPEETLITKIAKLDIFIAFS